MVMDLQYLILGLLRSQQPAVFSREWFARSREDLLDIATALRQEPPDLKHKFLDAIMAKASGGATAIGLSGLISMFGTTSKGTSIAALSGAAANTAKLYWLGSIIGGGVTAGSFLLIILTFGIGYFFLRWWKGMPREEN